jgi:multicomponent Na+:H+ antiporter subunit G
VTAVVGDLLIVAGLAILTLAVYGVVRMPDVYTQMHAASKAGFLGIAFLLLSAALRGDWGTAARVALVVFLLAVTTPVAAHAIARAARRRGERMRSPRTIDESR